jgi:hypothetical protein
MQVLNDEKLAIAKRDEAQAFEKAVESDNGSCAPAHLPHLRCSTLGALCDSAPCSLRTFV